MQFTELRCGGVVVGCTFDHRAADAYSFNMFMSALANIAFKKPINQMPSFCRFLHSSQITLSSNSPDPIFNRTFTPLSLQPPPNQLISFAAPVNRIYYISAPDIARLQEIAGHSHSKFVCFTAYFWKILARSACLGEKSCSMGVVVNGRSFMKNVHGENFMENYFGNVLSMPFGNLQVESLLAMEFAEVAEEVEKWLSPATTEDHFLGLLDWVETHKPEPIVAKIYLGDSKEYDNPISCVVSSGRGFPEIDFGWGKAAFGSYHCSRGGKVGYVMPIPQETTGDWVVYAQVAPSIVAAMEEEPSIFRPLTTEYFCQ
ncbi:HXXXD-type acyl-transferase family protein [Rhynchospora pubera]|uniref:HXXXD-type acyl-transferase family protein n=1 Tax=Rhynchospora pubera TaxID=906938 RepID=A0AAV8D2S5_9POAL|nr:HXXXD-type acyl-transferase family protein [Rhynchospora pubera]